MTATQSSSSLVEIAQAAKQASLVLQSVSTRQKDDALLAIQERLRSSRDTLMEANRQDLDAAATAVQDGSLSAATFKRLDLFGAAPAYTKFQGLLDGLSDVMALQDPVGECTLARQLDDGLNLYRVSCPIGVLLIIFEARPEVVVQISALALKSGNAVILKGGKEAYHSLQALQSCVAQALEQVGLPKHAVQLVSTRSQIQELLTLDRYIDLVIPRGSNALVRHVQDNTRIPVLGHADGICSIFVDESADPQMAASVIVDAKTNYPAACNAVETILVHQSLLQQQQKTAVLTAIVSALFAARVTVHADPAVYDAVMSTCAPSESSLLVRAGPDAFDTEFLDHALAMRAVPSLTDAIQHINQHGSGHTDSIITESKELAEQFMRQVDSAGVYWNCSTRFADGFRYGFGAEIGVSTNKTHARGPVGLEGLLIYKYRMYGQGHVVGEYTSGQRKLVHQDIAARSFK
ncbi:glutamate-5-semialdehyde dehydrogenase [Sorochytrium milnesiophthora]